MFRPLSMTCLLLTLCNSALTAQASGCEMQLQQELLPNDEGMVFTLLHLTSNCDEELTVNSITLNHRQECVIKPNKALRLGDDYVFGIANDPMEAFAMEVRKGFLGQEYFDTTKCGQPVRLDVDTSNGPFEFGEQQ